LSKGSLGVVLCALVLTGCQTYNQQNKFGAPYKAGDIARAEIEVSKQAKRRQGGKDAIVWRLEEATILRTGGKLEASTKAFQVAEDRIADYENEAKVKVANEAGALLSNQANLPYRGRAYDKIMLNTYQALNYMEQGQIDPARVELIRALQCQQDAVADNAKQIEKAQAEVAAQKKEDRQRIEKAQQDEKFKAALDQGYADMNQMKVYADYVNPFTVYLDGLFFMATATGYSDLDRARKSFERATAYAEENPTVKADLETVTDMINGKPLAPVTYVIFETGSAPHRENLRIDIPIVVTSVSYVGAAFPKLKYDNDYLNRLNVCAAGQSQATATICSMDSVVTSDFKREWPTILAKTITSTVVKAAAATAVNEAARRQSSEAWLASKLVTAAAQAAVNISDCRTWTTLPKEFQVCRIPTPADRKLEISGVSGGQRNTVTIADGVVNVVYVKSVSASTPWRVTQMRLK
jgi:hypothetical protein